MHEQSDTWSPAGAADGTAASGALAPEAAATRSWLSDPRALMVEAEQERGKMRSATTKGAFRAE